MSGNFTGKFFKRPSNGRLSSSCSLFIFDLHQIPVAQDEDEEFLSDPEVAIVLKQQV